jgi:putative flippase GtrA
MTLPRLVTRVPSSLWKYLIAGGSSFVLEYSTFYVLFNTLSAQLYIANSVSFCVGLVVSFLLNRAWAFNTGTFRYRRHHQAVLYVSLALINLVLTNALLGLLRAANVDPLIGKIVVMIGVVAWNFGIFRFFIFARHPKKNTGK